MFLWGDFMKRLVAIMALALLVLGAFTIRMAVTTGANQKSTEAMEQAILCLLSDETFDAVCNYYGEPRQYWKAALLGLEKLTEHPDGFHAVVQVETFCDAHNPPYGIETMTFYIQYDEVALINFQHQDN